MKIPSILTSFSEIENGTTEFTYVTDNLPY